MLALRARLESAYGLTLASVGDDQLLRALQEAGPDLSRLADHLPISESSLMRDPEVWRWLDEQPLEDALRLAMGRGRPLRALSLGCSEGQEVYSLAITALGVLARMGVARERAQDLLRIDGLDISPARVERARSGRMVEWSVRGKPSPQVAASLQKVEGGWQLLPEVLAACRFATGNLLTLPPDTLADYDLVLCRHVLIYFDPDRARELVGQLVSALRPGALLILAPVEAHLFPADQGLTPSGPVGVVRTGGAHPDRPAVCALPMACLGGAAPRDPCPPGVDAESHRARALQALERGQLHEALRLARAATFLQPDHLGGRFLLARLQLRLEPELGRRMLQSVLEEARRCTGSDPELSNHQLALAASALLPPSDDPCPPSPPCLGTLRGVGVRSGARRPGRSGGAAPLCPVHPGRQGGLSAAGGDLAGGAPAGTGDPAGR